MDQWDMKGLQCTFGPRPVVWLPAPPLLRAWFWSADGSSWPRSHLLQLAPWGQISPPKLQYRID